MYAIIKTGGKQYRVKKGDIIDVELLEYVENDSGEAPQVKFEEVLFVNDGSDTHIGQPTISNFFVFGKVLGQVSGEKVTSLKYKRSHNQCRKWGHRQKYTRVEIDIESNSQSESKHHKKKES